MTLGQVDLNGNFRLMLQYNVTTAWQSIENNQSGVKVQVSVGIKNGWNIEFYNTYGSHVDIKVDGQWQYLPVDKLVLNGGDWYYLGEKIFTVNHNDDGTKSAKVEIGTTFNGISYGGYNSGQAYKAFDYGLDTIPRGSDWSAPGSIAFDQDFEITIRPHSDQFRHHVWARLNDQNINFSFNAKNYVMGRISSEEYGKYIAQGERTWFTLHIGTYKGDTLISDATQAIDLIVGPEIKPTFTGISVTENNAVVRNVMNGQAYIQKLSEPRVTFNGVQAKGGAWIAEHHAEITEAGRHIYNDGGVFTDVNVSGWVNVRAWVKDSRGRQSDVRTYRINLLPYQYPAMDNTITRVDSDEETLRDVRNISVSPLYINGRNFNAMSVTYKYREEGGQDSADSVNTPSGFKYVNNDYLLKRKFKADKQYILTVTIADKFNSFSRIYNIGTQQVTMSWAPQGVGINKIWTKGALDVKGDAYIEGKLSATEDVTLTGKTTIKDNWLDIRKGGLAVYDGEMWLNGKEIKSFEDVRMSDLYRTNYYDYWCPDGTDIGEFLKSDKVKKGPSAIHDDNSGKWVNLLVLKENNKWAFGVGVNFEGKAVFLHVNNGVFTGYKYVNL